MNYPTRSGNNYDFVQFRQMFSDVIRDLAGSPERSYFPETVEQDSLQGAVVYIDSVGPKDPAKVMDLTDKPTRRGFENASSQDFSEWNKIHTPYMDVTWQRTLAAPRLIEWGHYFPQNTDLLTVIDENDRTLWAGMRSIFEKRDQLFLNALTASSVSRVIDTSSNEVTPTPVSFPAGQQIKSAQNDKFLIEDISHAQSIFEDNYVNDEQVMALISPATKRSLIDNNDRIMDYNFVSRSRQWFESGELPDIYGVVFMVSPLVPNNKVYFFTRSAMVWNTFSPMQSSLDRVPQIRNSTQAYIHENVDCVRIDDKKVVWMDITSAASNSAPKKAA
jgi:hypothetical protein